MNCQNLGCKDFALFHLDHLVKNISQQSKDE